jgi:hypothetical protein
VVGSIKQGSGLTISPEGIVTADLNSFCSKVVAGIDVILTPNAGVGTVTISSNIQPQPSDYLPIGTQMTFFQTGAPPRWITENPGTRMIRVTSGSGAGQGGSQTWDQVFTTQTYSGSVSTAGASISGSTNQVDQTPSGSVSLNGLSLSGTSLGVGQIGNHSHGYVDNKDKPNCTAGNANRPVKGGNTAVTGGTGGNGGHGHSLSGSGSFNGNNMSHNHSVSGSLSGSGSFTGGSFELNVQYIDMIVCRKLSNPF